MKRILTFMFLLMAIPALMLALSGCAALLQASAVELDSSHLSCPASPLMVDGNLETVGAYTSLGGRGAGVFIKLDKSTYIKYIEIYAGSKTNDLRVSIVSKKRHFTSVMERRLGNLGSGEMRRCNIGKEVSYVKLTAHWVLDGSSGRQIVLDIATNTKTTPVKGATVREVKFYTVGDAAIVESDQAR